MKTYFNLLIKVCLDFTVYLKDVFVFNGTKYRVNLLIVKYFDIHFLTNFRSSLLMLVFLRNQDSGHKK